MTIKNDSLDGYGNLFDDISPYKLQFSSIIYSFIFCLILILLTLCCVKNVSSTNYLQEFQSSMASSHIDHEMHTENFSLCLNEIPTEQQSNVVSSNTVIDVLDYQSSSNLNEISRSQVNTNMDNFTSQSDNSPSEVNIFFSNIDIEHIPD